MPSRARQATKHDRVENPENGRESSSSTPRDSGMNQVEAGERFALARVAHLATVGPGGRPHLVPCTFALVDDHIVSVVDEKPKSTKALRRLSNIRNDPRVSMLVDRYDEDWRRLWWVRAD